jgi:hypothetical protein
MGKRCVFVDEEDRLMPSKQAEELLAAWKISNWACKKLNGACRTRRGRGEGS